MLWNDATALTEMQKHFSINEAMNIIGTKKSSSKNDFEELYERVMKEHPQYTFMRDITDKDALKI